jgi:hypothetical protein
VNPKQKVLVAGLCLYAALSLISMAAMSIGAGLLVACLLYSQGGVRGQLAQLGSNRRIRIFAWISLAFAAACVLSLVVAQFWPLSFGIR